MTATVEEIKELWAHVDALDAQAVAHRGELDKERWNLADALHAAHSEGTTERELAEKLGKSQTDIHWRIKAWEWLLKNPGEFIRPSFSHIYSQVKRGSVKKDKTPSGAGSNRKRKNRRNGSEEEPDTDYHGNHGDSDSRTTCFLCEGITPEVAAAKVTKEELDERLQWAAATIHWTTAFMDVLETRFGSESEDDDPILT